MSAVLEVAGMAGIVAGVFLLAGVGWALIAAGVLAVAVARNLS